MSSRLSVQNPSFTLVRGATQIYEPKSVKSGNDGKSMKVRRVASSADKARSKTKTAKKFDLLNTLLQNLEKGSSNGTPLDNLSSDQIRSLFFSLLNLPAFEVAVKQEEDKLVNMGESQLVFTFNVLKDLFKYHYNYSDSFLANLPRLKTNGPPRMMAGKSLAGQKLNEHGIPVVVETCIGYICHHGEVGWALS
jgi:hypothetical protein